MVKITVEQKAQAYDEMIEAKRIKNKEYYQANKDKWSKFKKEAENE